MSQSPAEQINFEVIETNTPNHRDSFSPNTGPNSPPQFVLAGDDEDDQVEFVAELEEEGFQTLSAPASLDVGGGRSDLGTSIVIIPPAEPQQSSGLKPIKSFDIVSPAELPPSSSCSSSNPSTVMSSSYSGFLEQNNRLRFTALTPDPIRPSSDWEIMNQSIVATTPPDFSQQGRQRSAEAFAPGAVGRDSPSEASFGDKLKLMWNNARFKVRSSDFLHEFSSNHPICLLGKFYNIPRQASADNLTAHFSAFGQARNSTSSKSVESELDKFRHDFRCRIWITYRKDFSPLPNSDSLVSDLGWGCMIRSGQMMLAQAFMTHRLSRTWDPFAKHHHSDAMSTKYRQIIRWFADSNNKTASPFSIHQLTELSATCLSKRPGDWFGPSSIAIVLRKALTEAGQADPEIAKLGMYVAQDCTVFMGDVRELTTRHEAIIIFVPIRLGMDVFDMTYVETLQHFLSSEFCLGIIGGKPKHSLYFIGYQGSSLVYLDPHYCQPMVDTDLNPYLFDVRSYHCDQPQKTSFSNIDPSLAIGFLFESGQVEEFRRKIDGIMHKSQRIFVLSDDKFEQHQEQCSQLDDLDSGAAAYDLEFETGHRKNSRSKGHRGQHHHKGGGGRLAPGDWYMPPASRRSASNPCEPTSQYVVMNPNYNPNHFGGTAANQHQRTNHHRHKAASHNSGGDYDGFEKIS